MDLFRLRSWAIFPNFLRIASANPSVVLKSADTPITREAFNSSSKIFPVISRTFGVDFFYLGQLLRIIYTHLFLVSVKDLNTLEFLIEFLKMIGRFPMVFLEFRSLD